MDSNQSEQQSFKFPEISKRMFNVTNLIFWLVVLIIVLFEALHLLVDYVWNDELGYGQVFTTMFFTQFGIGIAGFLLFFISTFLLLSNIRRTYLREFPNQWLISIISVRKQFVLVNTVLSLIAGWVGYILVKSIGWQRVLGFIHQQPFGVQDPYFHKDLSFFIYTLPLWNFILGLLLFLVIIGLIFKALLYSVRGLIQHSARAQRHLLVSVILLGIILAAQFMLNPYERALTNQVNWVQESVVYGISFTDKYVNIPVDYIMAGVSIIAAVLVAMAIIRRKFSFVRTALLLYFGVYFIGGVASVVVQNFIVSPNEFYREQPFIEQNVAMTRAAYALDQIQVEDREVNDTFSTDLIARNQGTIQNIRVNDARPLREVYNQLQTIRPYYNFTDVDLDRYTIDGAYRQVFISARELTQANLNEQAQTWVNQNLKYTHGYGLAVSAVNEITAEGQPEYLVQNIPPSGVIDIQRPQIYFGENDYNSVLVNTKVTEFDYPDNPNADAYVYEGESGIPFQGWKRLLFSWDERSFRYLISGQVTRETQLLQTRNIFDRVERIAPFLHLDPDAYPIIRDDGSIVWLIDAYTMTDRYPFSDDGGYNFNYIRNSVKIAIDAYTGEVTFYLIDTEDPLVLTYQAMFPTLFTTEIPDDIRAHFRYPETLFTIQADLFRSYHMTDLEQFYNREDYWQFPTEKYYDTDIRMDPYYVTLKMEDTEQEEFILMMPFTPNQRQNLIAWMGVRNDGEHYGEMFVYEYSRQRNIYGPQQIENRINQNATISQQLNLWSQGGSNVIRGNLLVIPIEDTLLYVEPIYLESTNTTSLPEVKQIVVAYQDYIVMEPTLDQALSQLLHLMGRGVPAAESPENGEDQTDNGSLMPDSDADAALILEHIRDAFAAYREANQNGNYAEAGRILQEIETMLQGQEQQVEPQTEQQEEQQERLDQAGSDQENVQETL